MARATILDAFNAAAGFAEGALDIYSREQKYHLDTVLYQQAQEYRRVQDEIAAALTAPDADGNNPYQSDPEAYQRFAERAIADWRKKALAAGNGSRYYGDRLEQLYLEGETATREKILRARNQFARERLAVDYTNRRNAIHNDPALSPEEKRERELAAAEEFVSLNGGGPALAAELYAEVEKGIYELQLSTDNIRDPETGRQRTTAEWEDYVNAVSPGNETDAEGNYRDERMGRVAGAGDMRRQALADGAARIRQNNFDAMKTADAAHAAMLEAAMANGKVIDWALFAKAEEFARPWRETRDAAIGGTEYASNNYPAMLGFFEPPDLSRDSPDDAAPRKPPDDYLKGLIYVGLRNVVQGNAKDAQGRGVSIARLFSEDASALEYVWAAMEEDAARGNELAKKYLDYYNKNGGKAVFYRDTAFTALTEKEALIRELYDKDEANLAIWGIREIKSTVETILRNDRGAMPDAELGQLVSNAVSWINDQFDETVFGPGVNDQTFRAKLNGFKALLFASSIPEYGGLWGIVKPNANDLRSMIKAMEALQKYRDAAWYEGNDRNNVRFANPAIQKQVEEFRPEEQALLESQTGKALRWAGYQEEDGASADVIGLGVYEDLNNGAQYKQNAVDGELAIQTRERGADGTFGDWKPVPAARTPGRAERAPVYTSLGQARVALAEARDTWAPGTTAPTGVTQWGGDPLVMLGVIETLARRDSPPANSGISREDWDRLISGGGTEAREIELMNVYGARRR
jgi:hypothetical protein